MSKILDQLKEAEAQRKRVLAERSGGPRPEAPVPVSDQEAERAAPERDQTRLADERAAAAASDYARAEASALKAALARKSETEKALSQAQARAAAETQALKHAHEREAAETAARLAAEGRAAADAEAARLAKERREVEARVARETRERRRAEAKAQAQAAARAKAEERAGEDVERVPSPDRRPWMYSVVALLAAFGVGFLASQNFSRKETPVAEARPAAPAPAGSFALRLDRDVEGFAARLKTAGRK